MIVAHAGATAAFDFDDTLCDGDLSLALLAAIERADPKGQRAHYEAACEQDTRSGYAELVETLIAGRTEGQVRQQTAAVLADGLADGSLRLRPALAELIWAMQRHRWDVWVVTASPAVVVAVAARHLGVGAHRVLGMWCDQVDGRFVAPTREPITYRQGKVDALASVGVTTPVFAAGDAPTDLEMLRAAQYGLVVDRGHPVLRDAAARHGWWIQAGL
jgi:phosphoserine phosphatase